MKLIIIVVLYNSSNNILRLLNSIKQNESNADILFVDNCSSDDSLKILSDHINEFLADGIKINVIENSKNLGFGKACNVGLNWSVNNGFDAFLLLNDDTEFIMPILTALKGNLHKKKHENFIFSITQLENINKLELNFEKFIYQQNKISEYSIINRHSEEIFYVEFIQAAFWLFSKELLIKLGNDFFNPIFHHYGEDNELAFRLSEIGGQFEILRDLKILHHSNVKNTFYKRDFGEYHLNRFRSETLIYYFTGKFSSYKNNLKRLMYQCLLYFLKCNFVKSKNVFLTYFELRFKI
jgi:GT2 family glycosyltransferase